MAELKNPKHEKFVQNVARRLSPTDAYISAGYSRKGAHASAARLLKNPEVCTRLAELEKVIAPALEEALLKLLVSERFERLIAIQHRWDALRAAMEAFAREDYAAAMKTGVVCRRVRWIGGKGGHEVVEYDINTALIEALNSVEKRAAVETGQEVDRQDISVQAKTNDRAEVIARAFSVDEIEAMRGRMIAAQAEIAAEEAKAIEAPAEPPSNDSGTESWR